MAAVEGNQSMLVWEEEVAVAQVVRLILMMVEVEEVVMVAVPLQTRGR